MVQARQELAQYPAGDREVCAGGRVGVLVYE